MTRLFLHPDTAKTIAETVRKVGRLGPKTVGKSSKSPVGSHPDATRLCVLNSTLTQNGTSTAKVWQGNPAVDTGRTITVHDWMLASGQSIESGRRCVAAHINGEWYIIAAQCPEMVQ